MSEVSKGTWRFPRNFWVANSIELFERAAFYGTFITLSVFLTRVVGFDDVWSGWIGGVFSSSIYLLPFISGAVADRIGFRAALLLAFALLAGGYGALGLWHAKAAVLAALAMVAVGGSFVKPVITGTVAKSSDSYNRARAYSIFYMMVNIGSFTGKTVARPVRTVLGLEDVPIYSAGAAAIAFILVALLYRPKEHVREAEPLVAEIRKIVSGMAKVLRNARFLALILITAGFWAIQHQLYASMPKYVLRLVGDHASPEWYANVNPLVVVLMVVPITQLVRGLSPAVSIGIALLLITLSPLSMSAAHLFSGPVHVLGITLHPITVMMIVGIAIQGLAECFLSPKYLEFASKQAPPGEEGLYLGYAHINTFFANMLGFAMSGYLLDAFCPDPRKLPPAEFEAYKAALAGNGTMPAAYAHSHYIWYAFAALGFAAFLALLLFSLAAGRAEAEQAGSQAG